MIKFTTRKPAFFNFSTKPGMSDPEHQKEKNSNVKTMQRRRKKGLRSNKRTSSD